MPKIIFLPHNELCPEGLVVEAEQGESILDIALANDIYIEHACEKSCACTTCHIIVREGFEGDRVSGRIRRSGQLEQQLWLLHRTREYGPHVSVREGPEARRPHTSRHFQSRKSPAPIPTREQQGRSPPQSEMACRL